jgi:hypothetical protein
MTLSLKGKVFRAPRGGACFTVEHDVQTELRTASYIGDSDRPTTMVSAVELTVYGRYEQNGCTDNAARVTCTLWFNDRGLTSYTKATAWNGSRWADFAEGGREQIARLVADALTVLVESAGLSWDHIAHEAFVADRDRRARGKRSDAGRLLAEADRIKAEIMPPIYTPGRV